MASPDAIPKRGGVPRTINHLRYYIELGLIVYDMPGGRVAVRFPGLVI